MDVAAASLRTNNEVSDIAFSVDGTWQKRYGHNSLLGASIIISIENGKVLDYQIRSKSCQVCQ